MRKPTQAKTITEYIDAIDEPRRSDIKKLHALIRKTVPALKPNLAFGMIGYGKYRYRYDSGREGDWFVIGLASQKSYISVYVCAAKDGKYVAEANQHLLPKASVGKSCIRFKKLEDIDLAKLQKIIREGAKTPMGKA